MFTFTMRSKVTNANNEQSKLTNAHKDNLKGDLFNLANSTPIFKSSLCVII